MGTSSNGKTAATTSFTTPCCFVTECEWLSQAAHVSSILTVPTSLMARSLLAKFNINGSLTGPGESLWVKVNYDGYLKPRLVKNNIAGVDKLVKSSSSKGEVLSVRVRAPVPNFSYDRKLSSFDKRIKYIKKSRDYELSKGWAPDVSEA